MKINLVNAYLDQSIKHAKFAIQNMFKSIENELLIKVHDLVNAHLSMILFIRFQHALKSNKQTHIRC